MVIFVSSIGRSGTRYLANLFRSCTQVAAHHLAEPYCHGEVYRDICDGKHRPELDQKASLIAEIERQQGAYFESNPVFVRGLARHFLPRFREIAVIHLLRDPQEVARSYANRDSYPSHPNRPWRLPLNTRAARLRSPERLTPFQENLCDWLDNELHYQALQSSFARTIDLYFADFDNTEDLAASFARLGVACNVSALRQHTASRDLDRNPNKVETTLSAADHQETLTLAEVLRAGGFDPTPFRDPAYQRFPFLRMLTEASS